MTWTCDQIEARLSDYIDGLLQGPEREAFEAHVQECEECAPLLASVAGVVDRMHAMEALEVPPRLIYSILDETLGPRETATGWQGLRNFVRGLASPKVAYGAAVVMATFLMLVNASGFSLRKPKLADLHPANVYLSLDRQVHLKYADTKRYFAQLRVVYEIESRLRQQNELQSAPEQKSAPEKNPGQTDDRKPGQPRQQNRANEIARNLEVLALECPLFYERSLR